MKKNNKSALKSQISKAEKLGKRPLNSENGKYFFYPNEYKDALCRIRIPGRARQILDVIERFTLGFNKREAEISFKTFRIRTGMADKHIIRARKILLKIGIVATPHKGNKKTVCYRIQMDYTKWKPLPIKGVPIKGKKATPHNGSQTLPIMGTTTPNAKYTSLNTIYLNTEKPAKITKIIEQLKTRKKDLEDDLKEKGRFENKQHLIDGIKEIDKQLSQFKNQISKKPKEEKKSSLREKAKRRKTIQRGKEK